LPADWIVTNSGGMGAGIADPVRAVFGQVGCRLFSCGCYRPVIKPLWPEMMGSELCDICTNKVHIDSYIINFYYPIDKIHIESM